MKLNFRSLNLGILTLFLATGATAFAAEESYAEEELFEEESPSEEFDEQGDSEKIQACWQYNRNPRWCESTRGCTYNYRFNTCQENYRQNRCDYFNNDPYQCSRQYNCYYDRYFNRCLSRNGGGGSNQYWVCSARDAGWEEHWSGHQGYGRSRYQAAQEALRNCQRQHGNCRVSQCQLPY